MSDRDELPTGTVTLLFTDIEGSTALLKRLGDAYGDVLALHNATLREIWTSHREPLYRSGQSRAMGWPWRGAVR
ncbi:MAG TPA: hypothetical protein VN458_03865 [Solirubrobacterales bacterium]|nr:hypothetical protein [Solirubrobacterales bacterium]